MSTMVSAVSARITFVIICKSAGESLPIGRGREITNAILLKITANAEQTRTTFRYLVMGILPNVKDEPRPWPARRVRSQEKRAKQMML
jgi:hypothetical protein